MKLHLLDRSSLRDSSITIKKNKYPHFLKKWHYHSEFELVYVLIGKHLPHMWINDDAYFEDSSKLMAEATVVYFKENFLGNEFFTAPEMLHISKLIEKAKCGIKFNAIKKEVIDGIKKNSEESGFERTMGFIKILDLLARHSEYKILASDGYVSSYRKNKNIDKVYEYIFSNFNGSINLITVAEIGHMNPSAFSRFFKRVNRKTFSRYVNEIRIGYACKLLIENKCNITSICYESGFKNISNFNKQFKSIKNMSPSEYLKKYNRIA